MLGVPPTRNQQSSPPPFSGCSKKKYVVFYFHVLAVGSFRQLIMFRVLRSFRKSHSLRFPTLHSASVHFTHLSTPQHKWLSHSIPQNHAVISFRSTVACPPTSKTLQTLQDLQPSTHKSNQLNSIPFPNALCYSVSSPPMLFSNVNPMVYFLSL